MAEHADSPENPVGDAVAADGDEDVVGYAPAEACGLGRGGVHDVLLARFVEFEAFSRGGFEGC